MGQYYMTVNLDKKEYLYPHKFGDGLKLLEFGSSGSGLMCGLAILLADGNGRGGGDLNSDNPIIGSWAGDRIIITGDYADGREEYKHTDDDGDECDTLYDRINQEDYEDISEAVILAMSDDNYLKEGLRKRMEFSSYNLDDILAGETKKK